MKIIKKKESTSKTNKQMELKKKNLTENLINLY